ncbi:PepSY domain-containing protein [Mesobacillus subterraneus]|uniref:PepSY domain-containing protein n=1 Tax=Mesobacillus subterraneus TaxID=285983 RepID=A0A427TYW2_9BACI|nr:PepSY domain-containing protein [Mesobacillus subterraneus]RSD29546.1 hypothetical protein EJA10_00095 [Mesobacillus subterraneus]
MKWYQKPWFIPAMLAIAIVLIGFGWEQLRSSGEEAMAPEVLASSLENMYGGKVESIEEKGGQYVTLLSRGDEQFTIKTDLVYGNVLQIEPTKKSGGNADQAKSENAETPPQDDSKPDSANGKETSPPDQPSTPPADTVKLSEERAVEIAKTQLNGVLEGIEFVSDASGGYYLVEIEKDGGENEDQEATIQVHAITGKILSVTWDD